MHKSLVDKLVKRVQSDGEIGVMAERLKLARAKNPLVFSMDFSKLPNELFTAVPPELQPFLPLLKSKSSMLVGNLKETQLKLDFKFVSADEAAAKESEDSAKLLVNLAKIGLAAVLNDKDVMKELGAAMPLLKELERGVDNIKVARDGARLNASIELTLNMPVGQIAAETIAKARQQAKVAEAQNNLKQIGLAMHNYNSTYDGFPAAAICDKKGKPLLSWRVAILPFVEENNLYMQFKLDEPWDSENNKKLIDKMPKLYALPGAKPDGKTHYRGFHGNGAFFDPVNLSKIAEFTDGLSNTIMVVETAAASTWTKPDDIEFEPKMEIEKLLRFANGKTTVAFSDGSVRSLKRGLGDKTWRLLIQKNDGEPIPDLDK
jgi:hypothetical protein